MIQQQWQIYLSYHERIEILSLKSAYITKIAISRQNICLGSSLSMRSFTIQESNSQIPAHQATLEDGDDYSENDENKTPS